MSIDIGSFTKERKLKEIVSLYSVGEKTNSGSLGIIAKYIHEIYKCIPIDERRYCLGDMDSKDFEVKRILDKHNLEY